MFSGFITPFFTILLAEMLDKSQLAIMTLSGRTKKRFTLFLGCMLAFVIVDGLAIIFGTVVSQIVPKNIVSLLAASVFILFGIMSFLPHKEKSKEILQKKNVFLSAFLMVFLSEWADKTQLSAAAFATYLNPYLVFLGTISALAIITLLAIIIGGKLSQLVDQKLLRKITGVIFLVIGIFLIFSTLS